MKHGFILVTVIASCFAWGTLACSAVESPISDEKASKEDRLAAIRLATLNKDIEAVDALIQALGSPAKEVADAAERALTTIGKPAYERILKALRIHGNAASRLVCARLAVELGGLSAKPDLLAAIMSDSNGGVRVACVEALANLKDPLTVAPIATALADKEESVRAAVIRALVAMGAGKQLEKKFLECCTDSGWRVRQAAVEALGSVDSPMARAALVRRLIEDSDNNVRKSAENAIKQSGPEKVSAAFAAERSYHDLCWMAAADGTIAETAGAEVTKAGREAAPALRQSLASAEHEKVRTAAVRLLAAIEGKRALSDLQAALLKDKSSVVRVASIEELAKLGDAGAIAALILILEDSDVAVRASAIRAIGKLGGGKQQVSRIAGFADNNSDSVREAVVEVLRDIDDPLALRTLLVRASAEQSSSLKKKVQDVIASRGPEAIVQGLAVGGFHDDLCVAAAAEGSLGDAASKSLLKAGSSASAALRKALDSNEGVPVRKVAARLLAEIEGRRANPLLLAAMFKDKSSDVRAHCADLLAKSADIAAVQPMLNAMSDESDAVRAAVLRAIVALGAGRKELPTIVKALREDKSQVVRSQAAKLLGDLAEVASGKVLVECLLTESESSTRREIEAALAKIGMERLVGYLRKEGDTATLLHAAVVEGEMSKLAKWALTEMGEQGVRAAIQMLRDSPVSKVRQTCARLLVEWKGLETLPHLGEAAQTDKDKDVRLTCVDLMVNMKDPKVVPYLEKVLEDKEPTVCAAAVKAVDSMGLSQQKLDLLLRAAQFQTQANYATEALGKIFAQLRDPRTVEPMVELLGKVHEPQFARALGVIADPRAIPALRAEAAQPTANSKMGTVARVALCSIGNHCVRAEDYSKAVAAYDAVLELQKNYYAALLGRGVARMRMGELDAAAVDFDGAAKLPVKNRLALDINLGKLAVAKGDLKKAQEHFKNAIQEDRASAVAWYNLGWVEDEIGNLAEAQQALSLAAALDQTHVRAPLALSIVLLKLKQPGQAQYYLYEALKRARPGSLEASLAAYNLAKMRGSPLSGPESARETFSKAAQMVRMDNWKEVASQLQSARMPGDPIEISWLEGCAAAASGDASGVVKASKDFSERTVSISAEEGVELFLEGRKLNRGETLPLIPSTYFVVVRKADSPTPLYRGYVRVPESGLPKPMLGIKWIPGSRRVIVR